MIFKVVKQLKQLQRKPRNNSEASTLYNGYNLNSLLTYFQQGFIAQLVEHHTNIVEVMDSNPIEASDFFSVLSLQLLKLLHNCEYHFHFYSLSAVHSYDPYHINFTSSSHITGIN